MVIPNKKKGCLSAKQGRPLMGAGSTIAAPLRNRILYYRGLYPSWGAKTIINELIQADGFEPEQLPHIRTINRYLKSKSLTAKREKHEPLPNHQTNKVTYAHERWQMDDKGPELYKDVGHVGMINIKDEFSSIYVQSLGIPLAHTRSHPNTSDYQCVLRLAFSEFGLPKAIQADHGSIFYENHSKSPFPTPLHLWLLGLGVELVWAKAYRPTDQATVERSHQTVHLQNIRTIPFKNMQAFQQHIDQRRKELNENIPCDTFGKAPLKACPQAVHSMSFYNPLQEKKRFESELIYKYLSDKIWYRKVSSNKTISIGGQAYYLPKATKNTELTLSFDVQNRHLIFRDDKEQIASLPIKGIDFENIAGLNFINQLINKQLQIPLEWNQYKINTTFCPQNIITT